MHRDPFADPRRYGHSFADVYDAWYADVSDVSATAERVTALAPRGAPIVELGVGTGRLALPIAGAGQPIAGLDASREMLQLLAAKTGAADIPLIEADMAALPFRPQSIGVILIGFNTLFNLPDLDAIRRCLGDAAQALVAGGWLLIEAFVPPMPGEADDRGISLHSIAIDRVVLSAAHRDHATQSITGQHIEISERDGVRLRPWRICYATPDQLDAMAASAGLSREARHSGWRGELFGDQSATHVTSYRKAPAGASRAATA